MHPSVFCCKTDRRSLKLRADCAISYLGIQAVLYQQCYISGVEKVDAFAYITSDTVLDYRS
jgi:hypothetical protein